MKGAWLLSTALVAAPAASAPAPAPAPAEAPVCREGPCLLDPLPEAARAEIAAVREELARGLDGLRLSDSPPAYFATARWVRADLLSVEGSYGGVITSVQQRQTAGLVHLRVGTRERDSSNYFGDDSGMARLSVARQPSAAYARKQTWLAMDRAFRGASLSYTSKTSALQRVANKDLSVDFGPGAGPAIRVSLRQATDPIDREGLSAMIGSLSARFSDWPDIDNGDVHLQILRSTETVVDSEGLVVVRSHDRAVLAVLADTRASDGMHLDHGLAIHFQSVPRADDELLARGEALVDRVLGELREQAAAPMVEEEYDGPLLLSPLATAQLLASTVATEAAGDPAPWGDVGRLVDLEPAWHDRLGKTVLPPYLDLVDDPTRAGFGALAFDAEGFVPAVLPLVREGRLDHLLMTRTPNDVTAGSNGRARMTPALEIGPGLTNLSLVSRRRGVADRALERELLQRAQEDGYDFGYVVESLRDSTLLGGVPRETAAAYAGTGKLDLPLPGRLVRIDKDGTRTVVRGAILAPASMRVLRRIRNVGAESVATPLRLAVGTFGGFASEVGLDGVLSQTVDVEIVAPAVLIDGLELMVERGEHEELPTLAHPLRRPPAETPEPSGD